MVKSAIFIHSVSIGENVETNGWKSYIPRMKFVNNKKC